MALTRTAARLLALAIGGASAISAFAAPFAYITNEGSANVSVVDVATNAVVATVAVGTTPFGAAVNAGGTRAYFTNFDSNSVSVIDTSTNAVVATVAVGANPYNVAVDPAGARAYVTNYGGGNVSVIDTATNTVVATVTVGTGPEGVAVNASGTRAYVANETSGNVSVIDTATNSVVATTATLGTSARGIALDPAGTRAYVTVNGDNAVSVIDTATNGVVATVAVGAFPDGVAVNPGGTLAYVANEGSNSVSVIDTATDAVVATVAVGSSPIGVAIDPAGTRAYVANLNSNSVSVIDVATNTVVATVGVGTGPVAFGKFVGGPFIDPPLPTVVTTVADAGPGSLRSAIDFVNANCGTGPNDIVFDIPGTGPFVIQPQVNELTISCPATSIDGYSQLGAGFNTSGVTGNNAILMIELDGSLCISPCNTGLRILNGSGVIRGLAIHSFDIASIIVNGGSTDIRGNYLGSSAAGVAQTNNNVGVYVTPGAFASIGGGASQDANFISGGGGTGLDVQGGAAIVFNQIGGKRDGTADIGYQYGVLVEQSVADTQIRENVIRSYSDAGVAVFNNTSGRVHITANSILSNSGIGIDLGGDGPTLNDQSAVPYDTDTGANNMVNYPVITSVTAGGGTTMVSGFVKTEPNRSGTVELFDNSSLTVRTEGESFFASVAIHSDANGDAPFTVTRTDFLARNVSATTTLDICSDGCLATSEYAPSVAVTSGPPPSLALTPPSLSFVTRTVSTTSPAQTVTLTNTGLGTIAISSIAVSGDFAFTTACGASLAAGATCTLNVTFTPVAAGLRTGTLSIVSNAAGSPHAVSLSGSGQLGLAPILQVAPAIGEFAPQELGTSSAAELFVIINAGNATLNFSDISVTGAGFTLLPTITNSTNQRCGAAIQSGGGCSVQVTFSPTAAGPFEGVLHIAGNATNSPVDVRLVASGVVTAPPRALSVPSSLAFPDQPVGTQSAGRPLTIANNSASGVSITELSVTGDFSVSDTCTTIPAHANCAPLVTFAPTALGDRSGTLTIRALSESIPYQVDLTGTGVFSDIPQITLSVTRLGFGNTLIGAPVTANVILTNVGVVPMLLQSVLARGQFRASHACPFSIPVRGTCEIDVGFFPSIVGAQSEVIEISTNAAGSPHDVQVSGVGCAIPSISRSRAGQPICGP